MACQEMYLYHYRKFEVANDLLNDFGPPRGTRLQDSATAANRNFQILAGIKDTPRLTIDHQAHAVDNRLGLCNLVDAKAPTLHDAPHPAQRLLDDTRLKATHEEIVHLLTY